ncbi:unnamed protein product [Thlaspi arvense]|uniref:Uncharacterized protein n=1 Tax=Thlaspi arvense TaxID=13288 RepID=A0AAU9T5J4_THLAR|nr:unnamed protein product [Thlaspi arvense]
MRRTLEVTRPPGKKRKREVGEARPGMLPKRGTKIHCGLCRQEGHNRLYCESLLVEGPPKNPCGRPRIRPITSFRVPVISTSSSQASVEPSQVPRISSQVVTHSQPLEDIPSPSPALPKKRRGKPCKSQFDGVSSSQPNLTTRQEPIYDTEPLHLRRETDGLFTSSLTGDDYVCIGSRVTDTNDNTILPRRFIVQERRTKLAACNRSREKKKTTEK